MMITFDLGKRRKLINRLTNEKREVRRDIENQTYRDHESDAESAVQILRMSF
jgi:hypothetical protein